MDKSLCKSLGVVVRRFFADSDPVSVAKRGLLKSAKFGYRRDVSGITPSSVVAVRPESNVSEYTHVLW